MKHTITYIGILAILTVATACESNRIESNNAPTATQLSVTATCGHEEMRHTKTTVTPHSGGLTVAWSENDEIRIMKSASETCSAIDLQLSEGAGSKTAVFKGTGFSDQPTESPVKYQAFYPVSVSGNSPEEWKINATYEGQVQTGNNNADHLTSFDYLTTAELNDLEQPLQFAHIGIVFCFDITLQDVITSIPKSITMTTVSDDNVPTANGGLYKNCNKEKTSSLTLRLNECSSDNGNFKVYMICLCDIPSGQKLSILLTLQDGSEYLHSLRTKQSICCEPTNNSSAGISYVVPLSQWEKVANSVFDSNTQAMAFTGAGSDTDPYIIDNAEKLKYLVEANNNFQDKYFRLQTNITIQDNTDWKPIGTQTPFAGNFDGNGCSINGKFQNTNATYPMGFFSRTQNATISNLIVNTDISYSHINIGGIVGEATNTTISNCHYDGNISFGMPASTYNIGGIIGNAMQSCRINDCTVRGTIQGLEEFITTHGANIGGIIGFMPSTCTIERCDNYSEIHGDTYKVSFSYIGGIVGSVIGNTASADGRIASCKNHAKIYGGYATSKTSYTGGIIGDAACVILDNLENLGDICTPTTANSCYIGGITGNFYTRTTMSNCINRGNIIGYAKTTFESCTGGLSGKMNDDKTNVSSIHQSHNQGNISVIVSGTPDGTVYVGSYVGNMLSKSYVYSCCSTAPNVIVKDKDGNSISTEQPTYYIGNGQGRSNCLDSHSTQLQ